MLNQYPHLSCIGTDRVPPTPSCRRLCCANVIRSDKDALYQAQHANSIQDLGRADG